MVGGDDIVKSVSNPVPSSSSSSSLDVNRKGTEPDVLTLDRTIEAWSSSGVAGGSNSGECCGANGWAAGVDPNLLADPKGPAGAEGGPAGGDLEVEEEACLDLFFLCFLDLPEWLDDDFDLDVERPRE